MALAANRDVDHYIDQELRSFQVAASAHVFKGAVVGVSAAGYAGPLTPGDPFVGIAYEEMDNSSGGAGDLSVRVYTLGDFGYPLSGALLADVGRPVFASADDALTFNGSPNSYVGVVQDFVSAGEIILRIDPHRRMIKTATHAVENLAAGADIASRAVHAFDQNAWIVSARVVNQATPASGIDASNTCVLTLATGAGTVVTETFAGQPLFPGPNTDRNLGAVSNAHVAAGDVMTLAVTNGTTADPGPFLVEIDYL